MYTDPNKKEYKCKLKKCQYGLPEASFNWYLNISKYLIESGEKQMKSDQCIFQFDHKLMLLIYFDDILLFSNEIDNIDKIKETIGKKFKYRDNGCIKKFLGIEFSYEIENSVLKMSIKNKIEQLYQDYCELVPKPTKVPLSSDTILDIQSEPSKSVTRFRSVLGSMSFVISRVRPDLTVYIIKLAKFMQDPSEHHEKLLFKVLSYLYNTRNYAWYTKRTSIQMVKCIFILIQTFRIRNWIKEDQLVLQSL